MKHRVALAAAVTCLITGLVAGCGPASPGGPTQEIPSPVVPTDTPTPEPPTGLLPDLVVASLSVYMEGFTGHCVPDLGPVVADVCVENRGQADAGEFVVSAGGVSWTVEGLAAGEQTCLHGQGPFGAIEVDAGNAIAEMDETNNVAHPPTLTPPPICTTTPAP
jgi:hypothetical protein